MRSWMLFISLLILLFAENACAAEKGLVLDINGAIGPATQDYIQRGIDFAKQEHAALIILQIDTPGGLETSMRGINEAIITSPIPVITYVTPSGARAASAGTFILYASHLAAMAPGTNVGAASPVNLVSAVSQTDAKTPSTEETKAINDASAYIRSLAQLRGRNAEWAQLAVQKAASVSAEEAKKINIINVVADNYSDLLKKINGHTVVVLGKVDTLNTNNLQLQTMSPDWRYQFLSFITNPNVAYILMLLAIYGLFFELSNPGLIMPGVAGIISLLLVLYAFQLMPINYTGLALIAVGVAFMIFEIYVSSFGVIGIGGVIAFFIGSVMLFDVPQANYHLSWELIAIMGVMTVIFFFMIITLAIRSHKKNIVTGREGLIGSEGVVLNVSEEHIIVRVLGEIWDAQSEVALRVGQKIKVRKVHGLTLDVVPLKNIGKDA